MCFIHKKENDLILHLDMSAKNVMLFLGQLPLPSLFFMKINEINDSITLQNK